MELSRRRKQFLNIFTQIFFSISKNDLPKFQKLSLILSVKYNQSFICDKLNLIPEKVESKKKNLVVDMYINFFSGTIMVVFWHLPYSSFSFTKQKNVIVWIWCFCDMKGRMKLYFALLPSSSNSFQIVQTC